MSDVRHVAELVVRQTFTTVTTTSASAATAAATSSSSPLACLETNDFDGRIGVRVSAIFVILVGSLFGTMFLSH